jgi:hypothetical protein
VPQSTHAGKKAALLIGTERVRRSQMTRAKGLTIGISIVLTTAGTLTYLAFFASEFHGRLFLAFVIAFQLCFIWTCAEILDRSERRSDAH